MSIDTAPDIFLNDVISHTSKSLEFQNGNVLDLHGVKTFFKNMNTKGGPLKVQGDYERIDSLCSAISALRTQNPEYYKELVLQIQTMICDFSQVGEPLHGSMTARVATKPLGYAGDYLDMEGIYERQLGDIKRLGFHANSIGERWDDYYFQLDAAVAVFDRLIYLKQKVIDLLDRTKEKNVQIYELASGPGRLPVEVFKILGNSDRHRFGYTGIDREFEAKVYASEHATLHFGKTINDIITFKEANAFSISSDRPLDMIISSGLLDYFSDGVFVKLLKRSLRMLKEGGEVIIGNFNKNNPTQGVMGAFYDWNLIHRPEEDLRRLGEEGGFSEDNISVEHIKNSAGVEIISFLHAKK